MEWIRCSECGHKLFRIDGREQGTKLEVKCSSCKSILIFELDGGKCSVRPIDGPTSDSMT